MSRLFTHWKKLSRAKKTAILLPFLVLLAIAGWRQWRIWSFPDIGEPFDIEAFLEPYLDEGHENAFSTYAAARMEYNYLQNWTEAQWDNVEASYLNFESANWKTKQWAQDNQKFLARCREGTELPLGYEVRPDQLTFTSILSITQNLREYARLQTLEASMFTPQRDYEQAWEGYRGIFNVSRQLRGSCLISGLVGIACQNIAVEPFAYFVASGDLTAEQLRQIQREMDEIFEAMPPVSTSIKNEYFGVRHAIAEDMGKYGMLNALVREEELTNRGFHMLVANWLSQCDLPRPQRAVLEELHQQSFLKRRLGIPVIPDLRIDLFDIPTSPESVSISRAMLEKNISKLTMGGIFFSRYLPATTQAMIAFDRGEVREFILQLQVALQLYHREQGEFPETLDQLVPDYLETLPYDPFGMGEPLRYRREGSGAVIYSVGQDGVDDGGVIPDNALANYEHTVWEKGDPRFEVSAPGTKAPVEKRQPAKAERE